MPVGPGGLPLGGSRRVAHDYQSGADAAAADLVDPIPSPFEATTAIMDFIDGALGLPGPLDDRPAGPSVDVGPDGQLHASDEAPVDSDDSSSGGAAGSVDFDDGSDVSAHSSPLGQALEKLAKSWGAGG